MPEGKGFLLAMNNPAIANGIVDDEISLLVGSKGELNHRSDHWSEEGANHRAHKDWSNNSRLVDDPRSDPMTDIGSAHTALLAMGEAIGTAAEAIGFALKAAVG